MEIPGKDPKILLSYVLQDYWHNVCPDVCAQNRSTFCYLGRRHQISGIHQRPQITFLRYVNAYKGQVMCKDDKKCAVSITPRGWNTLTE